MLLFGSGGEIGSYFVELQHCGMDRLVAAAAAEQAATSSVRTNYREQRERQNAVSWAAIGTADRSGKGAIDLVGPG